MTEISSEAVKFLRHRVSLRHLRLILVLEKERSITKTAERMCISQAAVSKTRTEIEKGIGAPLFEWFGHRLEVTEVGKYVLRSARRIVAELECLSDEFALLNSGLQGTLSIGTRTVSGAPFLTRVAADFKRQYPAVTIEMDDADVTSLAERLSNGSISLLFSRFDTSLANASIEAHPILSDRNVVIASPNHPLAGTRRVGWAELVEQAWCLTPSGFVGRFAREHLSAHLAKERLKFPTNLIETQSLLLLMARFQAGDFLTLLPEGVAAQLESRGFAHVLDVAPIGPPEPVCMMWRSDTALPPAARRFRDLAISMLKHDNDRTIKLAPVSFLEEAGRFEVIERPRRPKQRAGE
jgi:LysR family pca operon transcriptional activator